jgi:ribosome-binding factor A
LRGEWRADSGATLGSKTDATRPATINHQLPMKHRLPRVNELIKRELGDLLTRELTFPAKLVTIQQVDVTPDLKHAHVFISIIGTDEEQRQSMSLLHGARGQLQRTLSKRVILKYTPHLHFKLDVAAERGDRVLNILSDLAIPEDDQPSQLSDED